MAGRPDYCVPAFLGMVGRDPLAPPHGGFAPRVAVDARRLVPVHGGLSDVQAAMVEPATVALHAVRRTPPRPGETVVVQGCGPIGLFVLQCARAEGAERLIAVEPNEARRGLAASLGAGIVWTPEEAQTELAERPADLVFECAGAPRAVQAAVDLVRRGGRVNLVGVTATATVQPSVWAVKEVTLTGSLGYRNDEFAPVMDLMADGAVQVEPLHDATIPLAQAANAFASLASDSAYAIKVLVDHVSSPSSPSPCEALASRRQPCFLASMPRSSEATSDNPDDFAPRHHANGAASRQFGLVSCQHLTRHSV